MPSTPTRDREEPDHEESDDAPNGGVLEDDDVATTSESPALSRDTDRDLEDARDDARVPPDSRSVTAKSRVARVAKEDTLLSFDEENAPTEPPSDRPDPAVEELERRVLQLEARIKVLEMQRGERPVDDRRWLFWVGLLFALALGWQLRAFFE